MSFKTYSKCKKCKKDKFLMAKGLCGKCYNIEKKKAKKDVFMIVENGILQGEIFQI